MRELLQKSPAVVRVECRRARPGRRERKGAKGYGPEAPAAVAHRWWPRWPQHPVKATGSPVPRSAGARGVGEQRLGDQSVAVRGPEARERYPSFSSAGWWPRLGARGILR